MSSKFNIAIAGATGNVGREIVQILDDCPSLRKVFELKTVLSESHKNQ